jgi:hypothetical protein
VDSGLWPIRLHREGGYAAGDIPNDTDVEPIIQISDVVIAR